jgi:hypothetical protein
MKKQKGFTAVELIFSIWMVGWIFCGGTWLVNAYKLTRCDFQAPYKGEIIHGIGLIPPLSIITVWNDDK